MDPEQQARKIIDDNLAAAGWAVQDRDAMNLYAADGVAIREFPLAAGHGEADYLLYVNGEAVGVVEAKPDGHTLKGVEAQSTRYSEGLPAELPAPHRPLPFLYESTGTLTQFTNGLDPDPRSRDVFAFHQPATLATYSDLAKHQLRQRLKLMPTEHPLDPAGLWPAQERAIENLERSLGHARPRALIQMATGSGKTFTAANFCYRLVRHAKARRILFLVDRANLGKQTLKEFQQFRPPDDGRRFDELYNITRLTGQSIRDSDKIVISTIQRVYAMLNGNDLDPKDEEGSMFDSAEPLFSGPALVSYNPSLPIETFDFIVTDECHRSIYNLWRQVLEYFDAFLVGLTATPSKQTIGFFNKNLVMEYGHKEAVADGVNVDYDVYRIRTKITEGGATVDADYFVDKRDKLTRARRQELLDEEFTYDARQLDRDVVAEDQMRTVVLTFRDKLPEIFPGRTEVPKTLIFAKDDSHAEDIVSIVRNEFDRGNDFCQKITYRTGFVQVEQPDGSKVWEKRDKMTAEDILAAFRTSYNPRIAVTVDMIATGTDVKPLECLLFMRDVKSSLFFEQMKGRGVRIVKPAELKAVTGDAEIKDRFVIVDAVGVCETDKTESQPLDRKKSVSTKKVLNAVAMGNHSEDVVSTLAARLARLDKQLTEAQRAELEKLAGQPIKTLTNTLVAAVDVDKQVERARLEHDLPPDAEPDAAQLEAATKKLCREALKPFHNPEFRNRIIEIRRENEQTIDTVTQDEVVFAGADPAARDKAEQRIASFKQFISEHQDELTALQVLYSRPYRERLRLQDLKDLADAIKRPPLSATPQELWKAYQALEGDGSNRSSLAKATDLVTLVRHAIDESEPLTPFAQVVLARFDQWAEEQRNAGASFTEEQWLWLTQIAQHIAASVRIEPEDFEYGWFADRGQLGKAHQLFGDRLTGLLDELNRELVA